MDLNHGRPTFSALLMDTRPSGFSDLLYKGFDSLKYPAARFNLAYVLPREDNIFRRSFAFATTRWTYVTFC
jgi:hypothetical protein